MNNLLEGAVFPDNCHTPAIDIFSSVEILYIEEVDSFDGSTLFDVIMLEMDVAEELVIDGAHSMLNVISSYQSETYEVQRICYSSVSKGCPSSFTRYSVRIFN